MSAIVIEREQTGIRFTHDKSLVRVTVIDDAIIHVEQTLDETISDKPSMMVLPQKPFAGKWELKETEDAVAICTLKLHLRIDRVTGNVYVA